MDSLGFNNNYDELEFGCGFVVVYFFNNYRRIVYLF